jgi:hypothetical protein
VSSPPKTKPTNAEPEARTHVKQEAEKAAQQEEKENAWRVILLRGLIEGNLEGINDLQQ